MALGSCRLVAINCYGCCGGGNENIGSARDDAFLSFTLGIES